MSGAWHIKGGRLLDPLTGRDEIGDLYVEGSRIVSSLSPLSGPVNLVDAAGMTIVPGLIDLHVHLREPGNEEAETVESGCRAAARGGFTTIVAMPNTSPPIDTPEAVAHLLDRAKAIDLCRVLVAACITRGRAGKAIADMPALKRAGAVAVTDDGATVPDDSLMREAMLAARRSKLLLMDHALDPVLAVGGVMHEGARSRELHLPGIPSEAETMTVSRDIRLAQQTGCALHLQHLSAAGSIDLVHDARARGLGVSAETTPHHLALTDGDMDEADPDFKMSPPIRAEADREALLTAVANGDIQALATDHAPHRAIDKARGFLAAPFGVVGLETAVGITYAVLVEAGRMSAMEWLRRWTLGPAAVLGLPAPSIQAGQPADLTVLDLRNPWTVDTTRFASKSKNSPFKGMALRARAVLTLYDGVMTWDGRC